MAVEAIIFLLAVGPPEIPKIDRVFLFAFSAMDHLVSGNVRKHPLHKKATIGAADVPQGKSLSFRTGKPELI